MSSSEISRFGQGTVLKAGTPEFQEGIRAAVDYRGDVTIQLKGGNRMVVGYVYNVEYPKSLDMFPRDSSRKETIRFEDVVEIVFSGEDTAHGKSWEDWMKKKADERARIKATDVSVTG